MNPKDKKSYTYEDTDLMPFGKYKNEPLQDVPASYLAWLWGQGNITDEMLKNYIWNSQDAINQDLDEEVITQRSYGKGRA